MIRLTNKNDIFALEKLPHDVLPADTQKYMPTRHEITEAWDENGVPWHPRWHHDKLYKVVSSARPDRKDEK